MADRTVKYTFTGSFGNLTAGLTAAGRATSDFGTKLTALDRNGAQMRAGLDQVGRTSGRVALGVTAGLGAMAKAAIDWETAWAGVTKTVDGSVEEMAALEAGLRNLARTMPSTHAEIAAVAEAAGQLGVAQEDILDFTETMLQLAETTNLTADEAATSIAQLTNVMGTAPGDIDNLGAALVELGNNGASTERDIVQMAQGIAGAAAIVGLAESDVLGIANAVASIGIEVEAGGTAISRVLTDMAKATAQGGEDLTLFAEVAGVSAEEFATSFEETPAQAFISFVEGLGRINDAGGDVFTTLDGLGQSDIRVSKALLGMAADSEKLADSVAQGGEAWAENTALTDEYAKRLETTGSDVRIAWNNIKDAGIEAGEVLLPMVASVAEGVASMAQAFSDLPAPVRNATTGLAGIVAITGGGLWFTSKVVGGIVDTKRALRDLGIIGDKTATSLGKVGKAAGGVAATLAAMSIVDDLQRQFEGLDSGLEGITGQLIELSNAGGGGLSEEFDNIADSFARLTDPNAAQAFQDSIYDTLGFLGSDSRVDEAVAQFEALDAALVNLGATGGHDAAKEAFAALSEEMGLTAIQQGELLSLLPQYEDALEAVANAAALARGETENTDWLTGLTSALGGAEAATEGFADATDDSADANKSEAKAINDATKAMRDKRQEALSAFDAESRWGQAVRDATEAVKEGRKGINRFTEDGQANRAVLSDLASAWNNQSTAVKNSDERFAAARKTFIDTATAMGVPKAAAKALADELMEIPRSTVAKVKQEGAEAATTAVDNLRDALGNLRDKTIRVNVIRNNPNGTTTSVTDPNPNIDNSMDRRTTSRGSALPITVGDVYARGGGSMADDKAALFGFRGEVAKAGEGLKNLRRRLAEAEKAVDRERRQRDALVARRNAVSSAIGGELSNDLWATSEASGNVWDANATPGGVMDPRAAVQDRIETARRMIAAIKTLKQKGIRGAALEEILTNGGLAGAEFMAALSAAELAGFSQDLATANSLITQAGNMGAQGVVSNAELAQANKELREANQELKGIKKAIDKLEKSNKDGHKGTQDTTLSATRGAVRDGRRRRKAYVA